MKSCLLEAHRGVSTDFPENTMSAYRGAVIQGYDMIELDTKFTSDNRCVLLHDAVVNRTLASGCSLPENTAISDLTFEEARKLDFGQPGEKIPALEEVLAFAAAEKIVLKFDNVWQKHTPLQKEIFFNTISASPARPYVEFTAKSIEGVREVLLHVPEASIHYDGPCREDICRELSALLPPSLERLTFWLRYDNDATRWNKTPPVDAELSDMVHRYGKLGIWILSKPEERTAAIEQFGADIIETDGSLKP